MGVIRTKVMAHRGLAGFAAGVLVAVVGGGTVALAAIPSSANGSFTGCVNRTSGAVRIIDYQAGKRCAATERTVSWSKGYRYRGAWSSTVSYAVLDVATYNGSSWLAKAPSRGKVPPSNASFWGLLAAAGARGATGAAGSQGIQGIQGVQGIQGIQGQQGPSGVVSVTPLEGAVTASIAAGGGFVFVGPTTSLNVAAGQKVVGAASSAVGSTSGTSVDSTFCYQTNGTGSLSPFSEFTKTDVPTGSGIISLSQSAAKTFAAATTVTVGPCLTNVGSNALNNNDWSIGWVMLTS